MDLLFVWMWCSACMGSLAVCNPLALFHSSENRIGSAPPRSQFPTDHQTHTSVCRRAAAGEPNNIFKKKTKTRPACGRHTPSKAQPQLNHRASLYPERGGVVEKAVHFALTHVVSSGCLWMPGCSFFKIPNKRAPPLHWLPGARWASWLERIYLMV